MKMVDIYTDKLFGLIEAELSRNEVWCKKAWDNTYAVSDAFMKIIRAERNVTCMLCEDRLEVLYSFNGIDYATNDFNEAEITNNNIEDILISVIRGALTRYDKC